MSIRQAARFAALAFTPALLLAPSMAAETKTHDGKWSVEIVTEKGWCDVYRWNIGVAGGRITEVGAPGAVANGRIDQTGRVSVQLARGADVMSVTGAVADKAGSGAWVLPNRSCAGRWRAVKLA